LIGTTSDSVHRVALLLAVHAAEEDGLSLQLASDSLTLPQGGYATVAVTLVRPVSASAPVALSAAVIPDAQHVRISFDPAYAISTSTMTVRIGLNVPAREYSVLVQGYVGQVVASTTLSLTVTTPSE
jgi:hypothetical protein